MENNHNNHITQQSSMMMTQSQINNAEQNADQNNPLSSWLVNFSSQDEKK